MGCSYEIRSLRTSLCYFFVIAFEGNGIIARIKSQTWLFNAICCSIVFYLSNFDFFAESRVCWNVCNHLNAVRKLETAIFYSFGALKLVSLFFSLAILKFDVNLQSDSYCIVWSFLFSMALFFWY